MKSEAYGEELFPAKDDEGVEVRVGYKLDAIVVKRSHGLPLLFSFRDVKSITAVKRNLTWKCLDGAAMTLTMEDAEQARYLSQLLLWQQKFELTDAEMHRSIPQNLKNLQGPVKPMNGVANGNGLLRLNSVEVRDRKSLSE